MVLLLLFVIQRFGTSTIGKAFGPVMILWFGFLAVFGIVNILGYPSILKALSPYYAITLLFSSVNDAGLIFSYVGAKLYEAPADIIKCSSFFLLKLS